MLDNHYVPEGYGILTNFVIFGQKISTYTIFVGLGLIVGLIWFYVSVTLKEKINKDNAYLIVLSALLGGFIGSKILVLIENFGVIIKNVNNLKGFLFTGKSIVGGLIGGYIGIRLAKKYLRLERIRTGNKIAPAIALGMAVGRIGCFLSGCCYGIPTNLPIGIDFGDGVARIPTQLIEMFFCLGLFAYLFYNQKTKKELVPGILFKKLVLYYFIFRFLIEFIRDTQKNIIFLSIYQLICLIGVIIMYIKIKKENKLWNKTKIIQ